MVRTWWAIFLTIWILACSSQTSVNRVALATGGQPSAGAPGAGAPSLGGSDTGGRASTGGASDPGGAGGSIAAGAPAAGAGEGGRPPAATGGASPTGGVTSGGTAGSGGTGGAAPTGGGAAGDAGALPGGAAGVGDCVLLERRTAEQIKADLESYCVPRDDENAIGIGVCRNGAYGQGFWIDFAPGLTGGAIVVEARADQVLDEIDVETWPMLCLRGEDDVNYRDNRIAETLTYNRYWIDAVNGDRWVLHGEYMSWGVDNTILIRAIEFWECPP